MTQQVSSGSVPPSPPQAQSPVHVNVVLPKQVDVVLVDASTLDDYEIIIGIASICSNFSVGFIVAHFQEESGRGLLAAGVLFALASLGLMGWALSKRSRMKARA